MRQNINLQPTINDHFRQASLTCLSEQLAKLTYPDYPSSTDRLWLDSDYIFDPIQLPMGAWETSGGEVPTITEQQSFTAQGTRLDFYGRPLHPWFDSMITDPKIGIVTGKGFYYHWGANQAADPIVVRRDWNQPHVLLIKRRDTKQWALPGGFVDKGEDPRVAALRELSEETDLILNDSSGDLVYTGPVADLRTTANAWAETSAYRFELPSSLAKQLTELTWQGGDDAEMAAWVPIDVAQKCTFGSHNLLINLAFSD